MNKIQLRPPPPHQAPSQAPPSQAFEHEYASPPSLMHQVEACFGHRVGDEELASLNELLSLERKGTKAFAEIGKAAELHVADLVLEMELLQASFCAFLREEIETRGGKAVLPSSGKKIFRTVPAKIDLMSAISIASAIQEELIEAVQEALPRMLDPQLRVALADMQKLHHKNIERLKRLPT